MIVADASIVVDYLLGPGTEAGDRLDRALQAEPVAVPHLLDVEVSSVLRRFELRGEITEVAALSCLAELEELPLQRFPHSFLLVRAFEFRRNATVYDAVYLALAEILAVPLLTADSGLATIPGCSAEVVVVSSTS